MDLLVLEPSSWSQLCPAAVPGKRKTERTKARQSGRPMENETVIDRS
jgi:hypothetical protein